ncbi:MAG: hypothetical protein ACI9KE_003274 [Polyangiales bacterium]|jgi:hypothetical protein
MSRSFLIPSLLLSIVLGACGDDSSMVTDTGPGPDVPGTDAGPVTCGDGDIIVSGSIEGDTTWTCPSYVLQGIVFVTGDSTLTIEPGVQIFGDPGTPFSSLIVTSGSQLNAVGTAEMPIVFSSGNADGARASGDWAGVALLGDATINNGADNGGVLEGRLEGIDASDDRAIFGGANDASDCGTLSYVRIEFAGAELSPDNELNGLTIAGCGTGTEISYVQVHRGKDDGIEFFGGTTGMDHVVITGASDDSLDFDLGWRGSVQYLIVHQYPGIGDNGIEGDNLGSNEAATPRTSPTLFNATFIGTPDTRGMVLREGAQGILRNFIIQDFGGESVDLRAETVDLTMEWPGNLSIENSFFFGNGEYATEMGEGDDDMGFPEQTMIEDAARMNTLDQDPGVGSTSVTDPDYVPTNDMLAGQATPPAGLDAAGTFAGAIAPNGTDWTAGWTAYPEN